MRRSGCADFQCIAGFAPLKGEGKRRADSSQEKQNLTGLSYTDFEREEFALLRGVNCNDS